jgi:hypothetical protein
VAEGYQQHPGLVVEDRHVQSVGGERQPGDHRVHPVPASSALTRQQLGWHPVQPGLVQDLEKGHYFVEPVA